MLLILSFFSFLLSFSLPLTLVSPSGPLPQVSRWEKVMLPLAQCQSMATRTKWFRALPLKEVRKADGPPLYEWHPPQQHWRPMVLLDPRGGEWLRDPHRPETWEVGLGGTQQVWVADSWWLGVGGGKETISTWRTSPRSPWSRKLLPMFLWDGEDRSYFFTPYQRSERGLPRWLRVKNLASSAWGMSSIPGLGSSPEKEVATHSSILAWTSYGLRSLGGYSPWGRIESDMTECAGTVTLSIWLGSGGVGGSVINSSLLWGCLSPFSAMWFWRNRSSTQNHHMQGQVMN